jgi:DNA-binding winged helix-turn-helix (wHTH) protein/TolB-like protein
MQRPAQYSKIFRFGLFEADVSRDALTRNGVRVKIQDQPFHVLILLLERPGEIVTRDELRQNLWPEGTFVDFDGSLNVILKKLRAAVGDDHENPRFIETVPRRGYRFIAPVSVVSPAPADVTKPAGEADSPATSREISRFSFSWQRVMSPWPWALALVAFLLALLGWKYARSTSPPSPAAPKVIAVLPFANEGAGPDFDYLRYAIASDLATDLTYTRSVSVRPFASTSRYGSQGVDPAAVGGELRVTHVVAGGFLLDKTNLRVNIELVDVARNQSVWRDEVTVPPRETIALHDKLAARAAQGLLPAINISGASTNEVPSPKNERALDLFLHSVTISLDPEPNRTAIKKLEECVSFDAGYAPAWEELGWRYYIDSHYGSGGEGALAKALQAYRHAQDLDPNGTVNTITIRVEQADLDGAYNQAASLLRRRPEVGSLHYEMSYVLRYAGLLEEAGKECDAALAIDPGFNVYRSCATPFIMMGNYAHAATYIDLDEKSGFGSMLRLIIALRTGNKAAALAESEAASRSGFLWANLARMYLTHVPAPELQKAAAELEADPRSLRDAEDLYMNAAVLSLAGQPDAALRELRKSIKGNHCSYPAMEKDPLFDPIRQRPEFAELRQAAVQCQQNFLVHREKVDAALASAQ